MLVYISLNGCLVLTVSLVPDLSLHGIPPSFSHGLAARFSTGPVQVQRNGCGTWAKAVAANLLVLVVYDKKTSSAYAAATRVRLSFILLKNGQTVVYNCV